MSRSHSQLLLTLDRVPGTMEPAANSRVLLGGEFAIWPNKKVKFAVSLTSTELGARRVRPRPWSRRLLLPLTDCIGCRCHEPDTDTDSAAYFTVYAYPFKKKARGSAQVRERFSKTFRVDGSRNYPENREEAEKWTAAIKSLCRVAIPGGDTVGSHHRLPVPCCLLLFVNPLSGNGQALHLYQTLVLPMLTEAEISVDMVVTEHQNHARELVQKEELSKWNGIVVMSGDGLLYEVVNGLMERSDWESAIKKPLGILPGGSGNALAASVNYHAGFDAVMNEELLLNCTYLICKGLFAPMDLVSLTTTSNKHIFSFLSVAWGFISAVDVESEKYRSMGSARFTVGTLRLLVPLRVYKGTLSFLPAEGKTKEPLYNEDSNEQEVNCTQMSSQKKPETTQGLKMVKQNSQKGGLRETQDAATRSSSECSSVQTDYNFCNLNNSVQYSAGDTQVKPLVDRIETHYGPIDTLLPPLGQRVPSNWTIVEADFVLVLAIYQSHLGADLFTAPSASLNDGVIHLFYIKSGISRISLLRLFCAMEKGTHLSYNCPYLTHLQVKAFRLEPDTGILTVDGELVDCEPIQGQIHSGVSTVITGVQKEIIKQ
ncbi:sphingosine kinase 1 [Heptranchias perlo]|uniref:sphingosine kinase 1 n=1 Tax=Heptranchias perlo TaxID=212740 RepID=UPI0035594165